MYLITLINSLLVTQEWNEWLKDYAFDADRIAFIKRDRVAAKRVINIKLMLLSFLILVLLSLDDI